MQFEENKAPTVVLAEAGTTETGKKRPRSKPGARWSQRESESSLVAVLQRGAKDVAQRRPRIGGAILRDGLLLFGDFQRLDRDLHLAGLLVELDYPRIDLFANR